MFLTEHFFEKRNKKEGRNSHKKRYDELKSRASFHRFELHFALAGSNDSVKEILLQQCNI